MSRKSLFEELFPLEERTADIKKLRAKYKEFITSSPTGITDDLSAEEIDQMVDQAAKSPSDIFNDAYGFLDVYLPEIGFKFLASGAYGAVFQKHGDRIVYKVHNDRGYAAFVELSRTHPHKHFPKFRKPMKLFGDEVVGIEFLRPTKFDFNQRLIKNIFANKKYAEGLSDPDEFEFVRDDLLEEEYWLTHNEQSFVNAWTSKLCEAIQIVYTIGKAHKFGIDLHSGNFMQRKDGTIIITDPWTA